MESKEIPWLEGIVQIDEAYLGGKPKNMHRDKREKLRDNRDKNKMMVIGFRDHEGKMLAFPIARPNSSIIRDAVRDHVKKGSTILTDGLPAYRPLGREGYKHEWVDHSVGEYVRGMATTNGVESFWALLKKGYEGTYHRMAIYHIRRYVNEFSYRYNIGQGCGPRTIGKLLDNAVGCRLKYRVLRGLQPADCLANA